MIVYLARLQKDLVLTLEKTGIGEDINEISDDSIIESSESEGSTNENEHTVEKILFSSDSNSQLSFNDLQ